MMRALPLETVDRWAILGATGALAAWAIGNTTIAVLTLLAVMAIDIVTGLLVARQRRSVTSRRLGDGLRRKALSVCLVLLGAVLEPQFHSLVPIGVDLSDALALTFTASELISILENAVRGGIAVPPLLLGLVRLLQRPDEPPAKTE